MKSTTHKALGHPSIEVPKAATIPLKPAQHEARIPSSLYPDVIYAMNILGEKSNIGEVGYVALFGADTSTPSLVVVTELDIKLPGLHHTSVELLNPRDVNSMPQIQEVFIKGTRLLGQREQLAATIVRLSDRITLAGREQEVRSMQTPVHTDVSIAHVL